MNRRTRREDGRGQREGLVEFEHLLDAVRGTQLPPPVPTAGVASADAAEVAADVASEVLVGTQAEPDIDEECPNRPTEPDVAAEPAEPLVDRAELSINDDLLPAPRRRRWGRR